MADLVVMEHTDLVSGADLTEQLRKAYGPEGLGVLAIRGVPGFVEQCRRVLDMGHAVGHLPASTKAKLEDEASMYNAGWSFGKEKLGDKPDTSKGSFYFNPLSDTPGTPEQREKFPWALPPNRWPTEDLPDLEHACKALGQSMHREVQLLATQVDELCKNLLPERYPHPDLGLLADTMAKTVKCKGRLLYYYPVEVADGAVKEDGWIGWHNDSGFLTALTPDRFVNDETGEEVTNVDPNGGLWVVNRNGSATKVNIPKDCLAVQCGECLQVLSGGILVATPHCVRPAKPPAGVRLARISCPCFVDTDPEFPLRMPAGCTRKDVLEAAVDSGKVPALADRWLEDGQTFADFLGTTFQRYYQWALPN